MTSTPVETVDEAMNKLFEYVIDNEMNFTCEEKSVESVIWDDEEIGLREKILLMMKINDGRSSNLETW